LSRSSAIPPLALGLALSLGLLASPARSEQDDAIAMYGQPALPPDFVSLPYANPDAPKGGRIVFGEVGSFDSLNPHILKGTAPWGVGAHVLESLMGRNWNEPFSLYGLLAESVKTDPDRSWVEFTLRPEAKFSDGNPVTVADVIWSLETLAKEGHPRFAASSAKIARIEQTGPRSLKITFNTPDRELPLIMGLRPIFEKAQWQGKDFAASSLTPVIGSGPYVIDQVDPGRKITFRRNPDYWGKDLPFNKGRNNFDNALFEAFKAGEVTVYREGNPARWADSYDFPAVKDGRIVKSEVPNQRPSGIFGLVMNTRRDVFKDWRVRDAMIQAFNYEYVAQTQTGGADPRICSYFCNSVLAMSHGPAEGRVKALLEPFKDQLLPGALDGYSLPVSDGTERNRKNLALAMDELQEAGWTPKQGVLSNAAGEPFTFDILLQQGSAEQQAIVNIYMQALKRLGMQVTTTTIDSAQYTQRTDDYDFDMTFYRRGLSLSPGNEQLLYWGHQGVSVPGSRNWMGMDSPAAEAMIQDMLTATSQEEFTDATRALDRILTTGRYVIPLWYSKVSRIAHAAELHYPDHLPIYGDWDGFLPDVWWSQK